MYRAGLLAALLLAVVAAAGATLTCTVESSTTKDTTDDISVSFKFESIAPAFPGSGHVGFKATLTTTYAYLYSPVDSVQWDGPLEFKVTLEHYAPNQSWRIDKYKCVYNNSGNVEMRYYDVLAQKPQRRTTTITFKVPPTAANTALQPPSKSPSRSKAPTARRHPPSKAGPTAPPPEQTPTKSQLSTETGKPSR
jgi:hypothetical protein